MNKIMLFGYLVGIALLSGCSIDAKVEKLTASALAGLSACSLNTLLTGECKASANQVVTTNMGSDVQSWINVGASTTVSGVIADGYYQDKVCSFTDSDLLAANIRSGTEIFGVTGTLAEGFANCTDDALNAGRCSTAINRYVYTTQYGGRSPACSVGLNASGCWTNASNQYVTGTAGSDVTVWANTLASTSVIASVPTGYYDGRSCTFTDANLLASNIRNGTSVFGVTGNFTGSFQTSMASSALRDTGVQVIPNLTGQTTSNQISLDSEVSLYAGADLPTAGGYNYRDIPDMSKDDEGYNGTSCKYAPRPASDCGMSQNSIAGRIANCASVNPSTSTWNGAAQCNRGQGIWKLVTRNGANKEVWQDQRTGLLWSSVVNGAINWCKASGNAQETPLTFINSFNNAAGTSIVGNGTIGSLSSGASSNGETITVTFSDATTFSVSGSAGAGGCQGGAVTGALTTIAGSSATYSKAGECSFTITQGSTNFAANDKFTLQSIANASYSCLPGAASGLQPATPVSYCAEATGLASDASENWGSGVYMAAKGGMGKTSTAQSPIVRWRLPSIEDYNIANANGIRFVMPDMGIVGTSRPTSDNSQGSYGYEWSSSVVSDYRGFAWIFNSSDGYVDNNFRDSTYAVRCVGR